jgi:hypothetical protein
LSVVCNKSDELRLARHSRTNKKGGSGGSKQDNKPKPNKQNKSNKQNYKPNKQNNKPNKQNNKSDKQNNKANQAQKIMVDQDSGDVTVWIEGDGVTIGSINTGNAANATASQPAKQ